MKAQTDRSVEAKSQTLESYVALYHRSRKGRIARSTYEREEIIVRKAVRLFGAVPLQDVDPGLINERFRCARLEGMISEGDLLRIHSLLNGAFKQASREGVVRYNPMAGVDRPKPRPCRRASLSLSEARRFKELIEGLGMDSRAVACLIMLGTGCRRGEVLGLTWGCVHLEEEHPYIEIRQQLTKELEITRPKSEESNRLVSLGADLAEYLTTWRHHQKKALIAQGFEQTRDTFVAHTIRTKPEADEPDPAPRHRYVGFINPGNFNRWFKNVCADHGFGSFTKNVVEKEFQGRTIRRGSGYVGLTPHGLRHTHATLLAGGGIGIKAIQARLGHEDPALTAKLYVHAMRESDILAAERFDELLRDSRR